MKKLFYITIITFSLIPFLSFAQPKPTDSYTLLEPLPCNEGVGKCTPRTMQEEIQLNDYILYVYKFSIAIAVFLAIIMIIWGGFLYITSEVPFIKTDGKSKITNAVTGLFFVLVSYLILATIDPRLVNIDSSIPAIPYDTKAIKDANNEFRSQTDANIKDQEKRAEDAKILMDRVAAQEKADKENEVARSTIDGAGGSSNQVSIATAKGATNYSEALDLITNPSSFQSTTIDQYISNIAPTTNNDKYPTNIPNQNIIQNDYNTRIKAIINAWHDPDADVLVYANDNFQKVEQLKNERDFYIAQIQEDVAVQAKIDQDSSTPRIQDEIYLRDKIRSYQSDLQNQEKISASGLTQEQYTSILQARIDRINAEISTPKP
jgi:hypothetical protein